MNWSIKKLILLASLLAPCLCTHWVCLADFAEDIHESIKAREEHIAFLEHNKNINLEQLKKELLAKEDDLCKQLNDCTNSRRTHIKRQAILHMNQRVVTQDRIWRTKESSAPKAFTEFAQKCYATMKQTGVDHTDLPRREIDGHVSKIGSLATYYSKIEQSKDINTTDTRTAALTNGLTIFLDSADRHDSLSNTIKGLLCHEAAHHWLGHVLCYHKTTEQCEFEAGTLTIKTLAAAREMEAVYAGIDGAPVSAVFSSSNEISRLTAKSYVLGIINGTAQIQNRADIQAGLSSLENKFRESSPSNPKDCRRYATLSALLKSWKPVKTFEEATTQAEEIFKNHGTKKGNKS